MPTQPKVLSTKVCGASTPDVPESSAPWFIDAQEITVLSLNVEYYHRYCAAKNKVSFKEYLEQKIEGVDVLCVQEDLLVWSDRFLKEDGPFSNFWRVTSSLDEPDVTNSKLKEMLYEDEDTMKQLVEDGLTDDEFSSRLGNSIYLNKSSTWKMVDHNVEQTSTNTILPNRKPLGYRSVVCATLRHEDVEKSVRVMCTHLSGGRFEDAYLTSAMKVERSRQMEICLDQKDDSADNVILGDFNAAPDRTKALDGYLDVLRSRGGRQLSDLSNSDYYSYMMAPFTTLAQSKVDWNLLYKDLDGPTSAFGHVVDFFVTYPQMCVREPPHIRAPFQDGPPKIERVRMIKDYQPWITPTADEDFGDTLEESITDHNGVKVSFFQPRTKRVETAEVSTFDAIRGTVSKMCEQAAMILGEYRDIERHISQDSVYPKIHYTYSKDGPVLSSEQRRTPVVDAVDPAQEEEPRWWHRLILPSRLHPVSFK